MADQKALIANLKASGRCAINAEETLLICISSLRHLEAHERKIRHCLKGLSMVTAVEPAPVAGASAAGLPRALRLSKRDREAQLG
jgi:hypothetical protein